MDKKYSSSYSVGINTNVARAQFIKSWVLERFQAKTESEVTALLRTVQPAQAVVVQGVIRSTVENQVIEVGKNRYQVDFFALPVIVSSSGALLRDQLHLQMLMPALGSVFRETAVRPKGQGGTTMLSLLVPHERMRSLGFAEMFAAAREVFYSSVASSGGTSRRINALRIGDESPFTTTPCGEMFAGHLIGCRFQKEGAPAAKSIPDDAVKHRVQQLLSAHFASIEGKVEVTTGAPVPLYQAIEECAIMQAEALAKCALSVHDVDDVDISVIVDASDDPMNTDVRVTLIDRHSGFQTMDLTVTFNQSEHNAIPRALERCKQMVRHSEEHLYRAGYLN